MALQRHWLEHVFDLFFGCRPTSAGCYLCSQMNRWLKRGMPQGFIYPNPAGLELLWSFKRGRVLHDYECNLDDKVVKQLMAALLYLLPTMLRDRPDVEQWFLSKHPQRYTQTFTRALLDNPQCVFGVSIETQAYMWRLEQLREAAPSRMIVSAQPLLEPLDFGPLLSGVEWIVLGVECGTEKLRRPARIEWFNDIKKQCRNAGVDCFILTEPDKNGGIKKLFHRLGEASPHGGMVHQHAVELRRAMKDGCLRESDLAA